MTYPNPEQRQVLDHLHGTLLVLAPAGTGKTRLMADRLAAVIAAGIGSATLRTLWTDGQLCGLKITDLFYVALTRAKRHLILTSHLNNDWNRAKPASSFVACLR